MNALDLSGSRARVLGRILQRQAEQIPDATYLMFGDDHYSFGRINELANASAAGFRELGVQQGDTVAIFMHPSPEYVFAAFGANKLGAIWVPTNTDYRKEWLRRTFEEGRARVLVVDAELLPRVAEIGDRLPFERIVVRGGGERAIGGVPVVDLAELVARPGSEPQVDIAPGDTAAVLWTSGTTGHSKGVMQSHSSWLRACGSLMQNYQLREGDVLYSCLPLYNSAAWISTIYPAAVAGIAAGLDERFSVATFWDRTRFYGATHFLTLGAMHMFLWKAPPRPDDRDNPVRVACPNPMPGALVEPFKERFGIEAIIQAYGQSEALTVTVRVDDGTRKWKPNSAGVAYPGMQVKLLDDDDEEVPVGEVGEFCVRPGEPYTIFNGYFHDPEATLAAFRNLWYHTGDLGRKDEDGEFFFFDRKADYLRYKGRNISSFAVEAAINAHPAVVESAAYGVTAAELEWEAEIKVEVVLKPGSSVSAEELARFVNDNAPHFFVPRYIEFVNELPHTPTGRVRKFQLRERGVTAATWDRDRAGFVVKR